MRLIAWLVVAVVSVLGVGCASVTQGSTHSLRIDTETENGEVISGAPCDLVTELGTLRVLSGQSTQVKRSGRDLEITCNSPGLAPARARRVSRATAGLAGTILSGGGIGALIDHNTGSAYTYPSWIKLVFGKYAVLDRRDEKDGFVMAAAAGSATSTVTGTVSTPAVVASSPPVAAPVDVKLPEAPGALRRGDSYDYVITDRMTGKTEPVAYRIDRIDSGTLVFNNGARVERLNGDLLELTAFIATELDSVTPPGGWAINGESPKGVRNLRFNRSSGQGTYAYDVVASTGGEQQISTPAGSYQAVRIDLNGWTSRGPLAGNHTKPTGAYRATLWYSPELRRVIKFDVKTGSAMNLGANYFLIDESLELVRLNKN